LGLVDGINPCAIAMLLLFISLLSFTSDKRILVMVSLTFISAIFVSYFLFGTFLYNTLSSFSAGSLIVRAVPYAVMVMAGILFLLNMSDFVFASKARYDKVKNQLPSAIQRFNKRLIKRFTSTLESGSPAVYAVTFGIGVLISFTEFLCTGQAYLTAILHLIHFSGDALRGVMLLLLYNLIFVFPLIVIAVIAVMTRTIRSLSAFMRENLHWVKLFTALVFLSIFIIYLIDLIGGAS
jgi:cytochrome c biogenesis protein CcdA